MPFRTRTPARPGMLTAGASVMCPLRTNGHSRAGPDYCFLMVLSAVGLQIYGMYQRQNIQTSSSGSSCQDSPGAQIIRGIPAARRVDVHRTGGLRHAVPVSSHGSRPPGASRWHCGNGRNPETRSLQFKNLIKDEKKYLFNPKRTLVTLRYKIFVPGFGEMPGQTC